MTELSRAAKTVLEASAEHWAGTRTQAIAAALRAAAQTLAYEAHDEGWYGLVVDAADLYTIADELEGGQ